MSVSPEDKLHAAGGSSPDQLRSIYGFKMRTKNSAQTWAVGQFKLEALRLILATVSTRHKETESRHVRFKPLLVRNLPGCPGAHQFLLTQTHLLPLGVSDVPTSFM